MEYFSVAIDEKSGARGLTGSGTHLFTGPGAASSERAAEQDTTVFADFEVVAARRSATLCLALTVIPERTGRRRVRTGQGSIHLLLSEKAERGDQPGDRELAAIECVW